MIVIVGHGTSLRGAGLGSTIESYDCPIVRFNGFLRNSTIEDMGSRLEYLCTTTLHFRRFLRYDKIMPTREVWVYQPDNDFKLMYPYDGPIYVANLDEWLDIYRGLKEEDTSHKFCKGLAGIIIAAKRLDISNIVLFGFDNLWAGKSENFETLGTFKGRVKTTWHDYTAERKMFDIVSKRYGVTISHADY